MEGNHSPLEPQPSKKARLDIAERPDEMEQDFLRSGPSSTSRTSDKILSGCIEKISLRNFMCHSKLDFSFSSLTNVIIGKNGSGKSAILTALMVGLGSKTVATGRGTNKSSLIQIGAQTARIEITLINEGDQAYEPEKFGPRIIVRHVIRHSNSSYELLNHEGVPMSTKCSDVLEMVDQMKIQVDSPIVVLTQEISRNFLQSKSSKAKYTFFLKASQLDSLRNNYNIAATRVETATLIYKSKMSALTEGEQELKKLELMLETLRNLDESKIQLEKLESESLWAAVITQEKLNEETEQKAENIQRRIDRLSEEIESCLQDEQRISQHRVAKIEELNQMTATKLGKDKLTKEAEIELERIKASIQEQEAEKSKITRLIEDLCFDRDSLRSEIQQAQGDSDEAWHKEKERREERIKVFKEKIDHFLPQQQAAAQQEQSCRENLEKHQNQFKELTNDLRKLSTESDRVSKQLRLAQAAQMNAINRFGARTAEIQNSIAAETGFRQKPKGPLGSYLQLQDKRWAYSIERHCRSSLTAYMCDNDHDTKLLRKILNKFGQMRLTIYTRKFTKRVHNCPKAVKGRDSIGFFDVVKFTDTDVLNLFVDINSINHVLFYNDIEVALNELKVVQSVPRFCNLALDMDYNRVTPAPSYRVFGNDKPEKARLLCHSSDELPQLEAALDQLKRKGTEKNKNLEQLKKEIVSIETDIRKFRDRAAKLRQHITIFEQGIKECEHFEERTPVIVEPIEADIRKIEKYLEDRKQLLLPIEANLELSAEKVRAKKERLEECKTAVRTIEMQITSLQKSVTDCEGTLDKLSITKTSIKNRRDIFIANLQQLTKELSNERKKHDSLITVARAKHQQRIETKKTQSNIKFEIQKLKASIQAIEETKPDAEKTRKQYAETKESVETASEKLTNLKKFIDTIDTLKAQQELTFLRVRECSSFRMSSCFHLAMEGEMMRGSLEFDHENRTLAIIVDNLVEATQNDLLGLSGGERSFSTVCFLRAMWECVQKSPFRILDEFDIFMDMSKRWRSMSMIIEQCKAKQGSQFIILTPIELSNIVQLQDKTLRIQMMPDPKRNAFQSASRQ